MPRIASLTLGGLATLLLAAMLSVSPSGASASSFVSLINQERAAHGLAPLAVDGALAGSAQSWAQHMANTGQLAHDPGLPGAVSGWTKIAENVGHGPSVSQIWSALMGSSVHRANILDPEFTHVGVGFVVDARGTMWVTQRFMRVAGAAPPPPQAATPAPAPAPAPAPQPAPAPSPRTPSPATTTTTSAPEAGPTQDEPSASTVASDRVAVMLDALHGLGA